MDNYRSLFHSSDKKCNGDYTAFLFRKGGAISLPQESSHPMFFVLYGSITLTFKDGVHRLRNGTFALIDRSKLLSVRALPYTVVLKYVPPVKLLMYLSNCQNAFRFRMSTPVPIIPPLKHWIDELLLHIFSSEEMDQYTACTLHRQLGYLLIREYTQGALNELYVPFYAYNKISCEECSERKWALPSLE